MRAVSLVSFVTMNFGGRTSAVGRAEGDILCSTSLSQVVYEAQREGIDGG